MHTRLPSQRLFPTSWLLAIAALLIAGSSAAVTVAQQTPLGADSLDIVEIRPNFHAIFGAGGNIAVQIGDDGVVLVDGGAAGRTDAVLAAIKRLTHRPIRYIINTGPDADHVGGNEMLSNAGESIQRDDELFFVELVPGQSGAYPALIVGTERLLLRLGSQEPALPGGALPTETFPSARRDLYFNKEAIEVLHQPAAHTDGDAFVFFRRSDVVVVGDIVDLTRFPDIDVASGGSIQGEIDALNRLILLTVPPIPMHWQEGGTIVVPGHGPLAEESTIVEYRDMVVIVRDRIQALIKKGHTLAQITAADPTHGWNRQYGATAGARERFVEAIYQSLTRKQS